MKTNEKREDGCWSRLPVYKPGGTLTAEQLMTEQRNAENRERLLNLALHGTGVVHGFAISTNEEGLVVVKDGCIQISCGLALDQWGRAIYTENRWLSVADLVESRVDDEGWYTLRVHYAEQYDSRDWDQCVDDAAWRYRCLAFSLIKDCKLENICPPSESTCSPRQTYVCERTGMVSNGKLMAPELKFTCTEPPPLVATNCSGLMYDPDADIPLACLFVCQTNRDSRDCAPEYEFCSSEMQNKDNPDTCDDKSDKYQDDHKPENNKEDSKKYNDKPTADNSYDSSACDMRPVVYRSPLLYELINDADVDLPRIVNYSWRESALGSWNTRMLITEFRDRVTTCTFNEKEVVKKEGFHGNAGFWIEFSKPVDVTTLHPLSVLMQVYFRKNTRDLEKNIVNWSEVRVPLLITLPKDESKDEPVFAKKIHLCIGDAWLNYWDEDFRECAADGQFARVEITLRGQMIRDECGCMLDAQPPELVCRDHCGKKTGQSRPGGDWISVFRVGRPREEDDKSSKQPDSNAEKDDESSSGAAVSINDVQAVRDGGRAHTTYRTEGEES